MYAELLSRIALALKKAKLPYMIIGRQAVLIYAEPRFTRDIDITLGVDIEGYPQLVIVCEKLGFEEDLSTLYVKPFDRIVKTTKNVRRKG